MVLCLGLFVKPLCSIDMDVLVDFDQRRGYAGRFYYDVYDDYDDYCDDYLKCDWIILKGQANFQTMPIADVSHLKPILYPYKKPLFFLMGIRANLISLCLARLFSMKNQSQRLFLYFFDPNTSLNKNHTG